MTENEARSNAEVIAGPAIETLERFAALLLAENARQNLISRSTESAIWSRHLLDSLQLERFARLGDRTWIDVGSGPGLPGLVLATLGRWEMVLVESRRRRVDFLLDTVGRLGLQNVVVHAGDVRSFHSRADIITARAVAPLAELFTWTRNCADDETRFVLPKGRSARADVDLASREWHGSFHVEQSITDAEAGIVIADGVRPR